MSERIIQIAAKARLFKIVFTNGIKGKAADDLVNDLKILAGLGDTHNGSE